MDRSPGFGSTASYLFALLRLAFASAPSLQLNLARYGNSPVHSTKGTPSPLNGLWLLVSIRFQVLFHSPPGVLFTFPSRYWFTIGHYVVFSLARWSWLIPTRFLVSRRTQGSARSSLNFIYRTCTFFGWPFNAILLLVEVPYRSPTTPIQDWFGLLRVRSPLLTESLFCFLFL